jgi:hypothetical protein
MRSAPNEQKAIMTKEGSLLETSDEVVRSQEVRAQLQPVVERVRADSARKLEALMASEPVPLQKFGDRLPPSVKSGWGFRIDGAKL